MRMGPWAGKPRRCARVCLFRNCPHGQWRRSGRPVSKTGILPGIRTVLAAYDRTNPMALIVFLAVQLRLEGAPPPVDAVGRRPASASAEPVPDLPLPPLLALGDMSPMAAELVLAINGLGAIHRQPILASMYRHLAHWPAYLALVWTALGRSISITASTARSKPPLPRRVPVPSVWLQNCRHRCRRSGLSRRVALHEQSTGLPATRSQEWS